MLRKIDTMDLYLLVGKYPQLSESFIIHKAYGLANSGINVTILTRRFGEKAILNSFGLPPKNLKVVKIFPENGPYNLFDFISIIIILFKLITSRYKYYFPLITKLKENRQLSLINLIKYWSILTLKKPDILHFEYSSLAISYQPLINIWNCKFVLSTRGSDVHLLPIKTEAYRNLFSQVTGSVDKIHAVSQKIKDNMVLKIPSNKIFVNRPATINNTLCKIYKHNNIPVIISTGRLEWIKGYDYLLAAYALLKSQKVKFKALIIGDGTLKNELLFTIDDLDLVDCVELTGKLFNYEVLNILKTSDIYVLSSHEEGISNAVLEAMNMGIPVVSTNCGGMAEVINNNENGLLVPIRKPYELAEAIKFLIVNTAERARLGLAGKETIKDDFTLDRQIKVFKEEYSKILAK